MAKKKRERRASSPQALRRASHTFDQSKAMIVLRRGNALDQATVLNKSFDIDIEDIGVLTVKTGLIKTIILQNPPLFPVDVIRMLKGNELSGRVLTDPVRIDSEEAGGKIDLPLAKILSIVF